MTIRVAACQTHLGRTYGQSDDPFTSLLIEHRTSVVSLSVLARKNDLFIGAGLAFYYLQIGSSPFNTAITTYRRNRIGFVLEAGLQFPRDRMLFFDLRAQYRFTGSTHVGPLANGNDPITLPEQDISYNHWFLNFGITKQF